MEGIDILGERMRVIFVLSFGDGDADHQRLDNRGDDYGICLGHGESR
jgi:hypothetical protein